MIPTVTMLYTGLLGLLLVVLSFRVIGFVPAALLILLLLELAGENPIALHVFGALLFLSRIAHASGLSKASGTTPGRFGGALVTFLLLIVGSVWLILRSIMWQMG